MSERRHPVDELIEHGSKLPEKFWDGVEYAGRVWVLPVGAALLTLATGGSPERALWTGGAVFLVSGVLGVLKDVENGKISRDEIVEPF